MILYEFNILDLNERRQAVNLYGSFLDNYVIKTQRCNLYAVKMFFVEVVYNSESNAVTGIRSFKTDALLDKYSKL